MKKKLELNKETISALKNYRGGIVESAYYNCPAQTQANTCTCLSKIGGVESCPIENSCPEACFPPIDPPIISATCLTLKGRTCDGKFTC